MEIVQSIEIFDCWIQVLYTAGPTKVWHSDINTIIVAVLSSDRVMLQPVRVINQCGEIKKKGYKNPVKFAHKSRYLYCDS